ncbi:SDR family NAD(P)-dependent oxidoreductase [Qipengyuania nanhaisediminis]|uniref:SDR family NAD(P)-dependent oxidoreductase n=1 Tax=Qipengyuania nanhaisediminis TaxID=604088 RepID=UPI0038B2A07B
MTLADAHAVVTGAGTGIGRAVALALAEEGAKVSLLGRRIEKLEEVAGAAGAMAISCDVTDPAQVSRAMRAAREANGPIGLLVNNAGAAASAPFAKWDTESWRASLAVNLDGVFHCTHAVIEDMIEADGGRIVTIASNAGLRGYAYTAPYCAAKHGAVGLMRALAVEFAGKNITANAVCPGFVDTEIVAEAVRLITHKTGRSEDEARAELAALNPSGRLIAPREVASLVLELARSDRTGEAVELA